jgi:hypothetical protein
MQLKRPVSPLHLGLMAASCTLLSQTARAQASEELREPLQLDSALLYYKENAGRVQVVEPVVGLKQDFGDTRVLDGTVTIDTLSGATPNGAIPSRTAQTFAGPSSSSLTPKPGSKTRLYTAAPGALPEDPYFTELRVAGDGSWSQPVGLDNSVSAGGHASVEHDFDSIGAHGSFSHTLNDKNTSLSAQLSEEYDRIDARGGNPVPGSDYALYQHEGTRSKTVNGALLGVTQVIARNWLMNLNYSYDYSQGYLTDPYRILSVLDVLGNVTGYRFESRPHSRGRQSLYWINKVALGSSVLDVSYRRDKDSWGIGSDTVEAHWRVDLTPRMYLEPHVRWYHQSAADFYALYLSALAAVPTYMSADPRLAALVGTTYGIKFGVTAGRAGELSLRLEQYEQKPHAQASALPELQGLDLNPTLKATIMQLGWHVEF